MSRVDCTLLLPVYFQTDKLLKEILDSATSLLFELICVVHQVRSGLKQCFNSRGKKDKVYPCTVRQYVQYKAFIFLKIAQCLTDLENLKDSLIVPYKVANHSAELIYVVCSQSQQYNEAQNKILEVIDPNSTTE